MLPTEEFCIKVYHSVGICVIFKPTESQVDVSYKYMKWLLEILSWRMSEKDLRIAFGCTVFSPLNLFHTTRCCLQYYMFYIKVARDQGCNGIREK